MKSLLIRIGHKIERCHIGMWMLVIAVSGCVPFSLTYWEPTAQGGRLLNSVPGTVGYRDVIEFSFTDIAVRVIGGGAWLAVNLRVPEGRSASFVTDELELYEYQSPPRILKFTMTVWDPKTLEPFQISPTSVMHGKNTNVALLGRSQPKSYPASIEFGGGEWNRYTVKLPPLKVGDQVFEIPTVTFNKRNGAGVGPIN